ncbi:plasmid replication protein [Pseudomonas cannabina]|uniref:plasmid replication protein n=1 Tax=Pseudomonas cannabina TaxID=86840 RepID=UPI000EFED5C9|nr:plasmid replication protein [Pseudomonas cannabina]
MSDADTDKGTALAPLGDLQLDLFGIAEGPKANDRYSNSIELWDALPKHLWGNKREFHDLKISEIVRSCTLRNVEYKVVVKPALITKDGKSSLIYPGPREEFVEDALRKLAVNGNSTMVKENAGVVFTLYQLRNELKSMNHTYSIEEIKEAIQVCGGAKIECYTDTGGDKSSMGSSFFPLVALTTRGEDVVTTKGKNTKCLVVFHPMVTRSILELSFRKYNYSLGMRINNSLARFIYKRMSHYWIQASDDQPYTPSLVSFLKQSPRGLTERMPDNVRAMKTALDDLIKHEVVSHYDAEQLLQGRKIIDIRYRIYPHANFVKMAMAANKQKSLNHIEHSKGLLVGSRKGKGPKA